jgi:hypothetical protein
MMKKSLVSVVVGMTLLSLTSVSANDQFTIVSADNVSVYEEDCVFTLSKELTTGEMDRLNPHKCHGLKVMNAQIKMESGEIRTVPELEIGNFQKKVTGNLRPEKRECMDMYARELEIKLTGRKIHSEYDLSIPEAFSIHKDEDGVMRAISSHRDIELESKNEFFNHLAQATNILVNKSHEALGSREGFSIKDGNKIKCWSTAVTSEVKVNDEKYRGELTGNVVDDSRNYFRNLFRQGRDKTGEIINNVTSR